MALHLITVAIGGGHELDRAALAALVASLPGLRAVSINYIPFPQVLLWIQHLDRELPRLEADTAVLLLVENAEDDSLPDTVRGLISKDETSEALGIAIRQVSRGEQYISPSLATAILEQRHAKAQLSEMQRSIIETLTEREREILQLLAEGLSNKGIASKLYLSVRTVEGHLANIYARLNVHSRTEAMLVAVGIR
jgi:DNA-binding NarL/FixJ family response regulator